MHNLTISILNNKIFLEIINEIKLFSKFKVKHYDNLDICLKDAEKQNFLVVLFADNTVINFLKKNTVSKFPYILIYDSNQHEKIIANGISEKLSMPFSIVDFEKKITSLVAKSEFKKNSLIQLLDYIIDKNERKIKKNNIELQLSEKEINFLILFSKKKEPLSRNEVLKSVWNYSSDTETHTVETHIHRLRKKILEKFGDGNFIKNNNEGYYI